LKKVVIDTNALISFVTDRNPAQQEKIAGVIEAASRLKLMILCHQNVLTEFVYVMEKVYHLPKGEIHGMVKDFIAMPGVEIVHDLDCKTLLSLWPEMIADFGDAILAAFGKSRKDAEIVSFDAGFVKVARKIGLKVHSF